MDCQRMRFKTGVSVGISIAIATFSCILLLPKSVVAADDVLMFGNSYTSYNGLSEMLEMLLQDGLEDLTKTVRSITSGGKTIDYHATEVAKSGSSHATHLASLGEVLILQDQSQVPSCTCYGEYSTSRVGAASIRRAMPSHADLIFFQTWGRRTHDGGINNCFSSMQYNLQMGYEDFSRSADGAITAGETGQVYIAPVGSAFKALHDEELCSEDFPPSTCQGSGNTGLSTSCSNTDGSFFQSLYRGDNSHPSVRGSYLAACVIYATMTGRSPIGLPGPSGVNSEDVLKLQTVAKEVVLDDVQNLNYMVRNIDATASPTTTSPTPSPVIQNPGPTVTTQPTASPKPLVCKDKSNWKTFKLQNGKRKTCEWLRNRPEARRNKVCNNRKGARRKCPVTCGTCPIPST